MATMIDPVRIFQINGQVSTVLCGFTVATVGNNKVVIAAVSGKKIRVMGMSLQSNGAIGTSLFKSASGGTQLTTYFYTPPNTAPPLLYPITNSGYFETLVGEGLYVDVLTTDQLLNIFYIIYTPT